MRIGVARIERATSLLPQHRTSALARYQSDIVATACLGVAHLANHAACVKFVAFAGNTARIVARIDGRTAINIAHYTAHGIEIIACWLVLAAHRTDVERALQLGVEGAAHHAAHLAFALYGGSVGAVVYRGIFGVANHTTNNRIA